MIGAMKILTFYIAFFLITDISMARSGKSIRTFIPLKKITVGPFDNFQSSLSDDESTIYFTRSQNLSSQVFKIDAKTYLTTAVTSAEADAKSPAVSPDGKKLAVTFYGNDAKGDICLAGNSTKMDCITGPGLGEHSPFWIDSETLGYVQSDDKGNVHRLFSYSFKSKESTLLTQGQIYGPSISTQKKLLAFKSTGPEFVLFDLERKSEFKRIPVDLPGTSGAAKFSNDGEYLYFAQYMLDSNRDLTLDGRDAAAIFRVSINKGGPLPEQLTSLDQNCSYPTPAKTALYLTCAFEGALDVYKAPLSGITPHNWSNSELWEAHRAARSYSDKILLLNQMKIRKDGINNEEFEERLFNNFVFMHAWMPAIHFAKKLKLTSDDYGNQLILLETLTKWDALPSKENVAELERMLAAAETDLTHLPSTPLQQIVKAYIEYFRSRETAALQLAKDARPTTSMGRYWQTKLFEIVLGDLQGEDFNTVLAARVAAVNESEETGFYYLSRLLSRLEDDKNRDKTLSRLDTQLKSSTDKNSIQFLELIENERQLYRILSTEDKTTIRNEMREIVERVKRLKDSYYAFRLLFARSIVLLQKNERPRELSQMMSLWLSYINPSSKEYPYAIEALRSTSIEAAYSFYNGPKDKRDLAIGSFYNSIRTTDDLESHYQYALLNASKGAWQELLKVYETMIKDGLVEPDSLVFVKTVHDILTPGHHPTDSNLEHAVLEVSKLSDDLVGVGVKYLFMGYLYHEQFIRSAKDFALDNDLAQKAHRSYLFALDAAFENERIQAAALQNLGLLHTRLKNYSMAAEFFQKRQRLPFSNHEQRQAVSWFEAKSLYQSYRASEALNVIEEALSQPGLHPQAFLEKQAFFAWNAGQYKKSAELYGRLIVELGKKTTSGIYLSYGYALSKAGNVNDAEVALTKAIELSRSEHSMNYKGIKRSPEKVEFTSLGLLSRLSLAHEKKLAYLTERLKMFDQMISRAPRYYLDPTTLRAQQIKEQFDLVILHKTIDAQDKRFGSVLQKTLALANEFGEKEGFLNQTIFNTLKNSMLILRKAPSYKTLEIEELLGKLNRKSSLEFAEEKSPSNQLRKQWAEIELIRLAYQIGNESDFAKRFTEGSDEILSSSNLTELDKDRKDLAAAVKDYRNRMLEKL
jgi:hypothetical protein